MSYIQSPSLVTNPFFKIKITHLPTNRLISLPGWVTQFSDNFTSNWNQQNVYGRMDPLVTFENTQRKITLAFDVVSANIEEAIANLASVNKLIEFLYPVYEGNSRTQQNTLKAAPLIGLEWTNLISQPHGGQRLVGYLGGVNYSPEIAEGGFIRGDKNVSSKSSTTTTPMTITNMNPWEAGYGVPQQVETHTTNIETTTTLSKSFIPKKLNISLDYTVLHTHLVGWSHSLSDAALEIAEASGKEIRYYFGGDRATIDSRFPNSHMIQTAMETTNQSTINTVIPEAVPGSSVPWEQNLDEALTIQEEADLQRALGNPVDDLVWG